MRKIELIYLYLSNCGIDVEIRYDRTEPYINIGNVTRIKERVQFWIANNGDGINMYVGTDMSIWYLQSQKSPYLNSNWRFRYKENEVRFPDMDSMKSFVNTVVSYMR